MRFVVGMLVCMGVGAIAAADPPPPTPNEPAASNAAAPAAAASTPQPAASSAGTPQHDSVAAADPREKSLKSRGYHVEMHNGEKVYCRTEQVLGSRLPGHKSCGTLDQLQDREHLSKDFTESAQRLQLNPTGK